MQGRKILITGPAGQVAYPIARALAKRNEVWGIARFSDDEARQSLEADGLTCVKVDLADPDFRSIPDDFDFVLHLAVVKTPRVDFEYDLKANGEATGMLMSHCRKAKAFLHCSSTGVYQPNGHQVLREGDPLGDSHRVILPTYSISKITSEVVARFAAREFGLPTIIARLNVPYGSNGGWPEYHLLMMKQGMAVPVHTDRPSLYTPIHEDDLIAMIPGLLNAATVPATTVHWCGRDHVSIEEWCAYMGELTGLQPRFQLTDHTIESICVDDSKLRELVGEAKVHWKDGIRRMIEMRHPDWLRS